MSNLLKQAASPQNLNNAWKKSRNDKAVWQNGIPRWEMEPDVVYHILKMSQELENGTYQPDPVRFFYVNKGDGKQRLISAYTLRDKIAQRAIISVLTPIGERIFHPDSFGYRQERSVEMALTKVWKYLLNGFVWLVDADIQDCFDNIPHDLMIRVLKSITADRDLVRLITRWLKAGNIMKDTSPYNKGIPQGAVLSPFLCNLYLSQWDYEMSARGLYFVRYADDFLVFARSETEARTACLHTSEILNRLWLELNPEKTQLVPCGPHVKFLGKRLPEFYNRR